MKAHTFKFFVDGKAASNQEAFDRFKKQAWAAPWPELTALCPNGAPYTLGDLMYVFEAMTTSLDLGWEAYRAEIAKTGVTRTVVKIDVDA